MQNTISLKIQIEGKEANATIELTNENIRDLYKSFKYGKQHVNGLTTQISSGFNNAREILIGVRETAQAINSLWSKPIQARVELEQAQVSFKVLLGDAEQADKRIKDLYNFTATTPFQLQEVISASRKLEVLTQGALSTGKGLRMVGDVASGVGVNINELSTWFGRLYDGIKSGRPVGEALMRLQELGVLSGDVRGKIEGLTKAGADNAEVWKVVTEAMKKFDGMMEEQTDTLGGKLSNLEDNVTQLYTTVGGGIGSVLSPLIEHLNGIMSVLNSSYPIFTAVTGGAAILSSTFLILNTTGILPVIKNLFLTKAALESGVIATMKQSYANTTLATTNTLVGKTGLFASRSMTALKAAFGPWGLALVGFTMLIEALGLLGNEAEETTQKVDDLSNRTISSLDNEIAKTKKYIVDAKEIVLARKEDLKFIEKNGKSLNELRIAQNEVKLAEQNLNNLRKYGNELLEERKKKLEEIKGSIQTQYQTLKKQIEVDSAKNNTEANLIKLKQQYDKELELLAQALETKVIKQREYEETLTKLTKIYTKKREEILSKAPKKVSGLYAKINEEIKKLNAEKQTAKTINELIEIEKKLNSLTSKKNYIELQVKLAGKDISDFSNVKPKGFDSGVDNSTDIKDEVDAHYELARMKIEATEFGIEKENKLRELQKEQDIARFKDVKDSEKIINDYYLAEKEASEQQAALNSVQTTMNALGFIAGAVNQYTVVGKAIAVAQATWNTYQAATAALGAQPWGPWNIALAAMVTGAGMANVAKIVAAEPPQMKGYAFGGRFRKGESGFIEGYHNEIIAPEKTFVDVFRQELRPQIYNNTTSGMSGELKELMNEQFKRMDNWQREFTFRQRGSDLYAVNELEADKKERLEF